MNRCSNPDGCDKKPLFQLSTDDVVRWSCLAHLSMVVGVMTLDTGAMRVLIEAFDGHGVIA